MEVIYSSDIDTDAYYEPLDLSKQVRDIIHWQADFENSLLTRPKKGVTLPWSKTWDTFEFRPGEVSVWAGSNGSGKSMLTSQMALSLVKQGQKVVIASFEMTPIRTFERLAQQFYAKNFRAPQFSSLEDWLDKNRMRMVGVLHKKMFLYDQQGSTSMRDVIAMTRYSAHELKANHIIIDNLMKCVAGEDDYNGQKLFVDQLTSIARDYGVHIHLVHHIRKGGSEEDRPSKMDIKGSSSITDQVDNVFIIWRNRKKENAIKDGKSVDSNIPDCFLMCEKQRNGSDEERYGFWFHKDSLQYIESPEGVPMAFDDGGEF
jgi:twinkle protein